MGSGLPQHRLSIMIQCASLTQRCDNNPLIVMMELEFLSAGVDSMRRTFSH